MTGLTIGTARHLDRGTICLSSPAIPPKAGRSVARIALPKVLALATGGPAPALNAG